MTTRAHVLLVFATATIIGCEVAPPVNDAGNPPVETPESDAGVIDLDDIDRSPPPANLDGGTVDREEICAQEDRDIDRCWVQLDDCESVGCGLVGGRRYDPERDCYVADVFCADTCRPSTPSIAYYEDSEGNCWELSGHDLPSVWRSVERCADSRYCDD